jgi:hypothetical protein
MEVKFLSTPASWLACRRPAVALPWHDLLLLAGTAARTAAPITIGVARHVTPTAWPNQPFTLRWLGLSCRRLFNLKALCYLAEARIFIHILRNVFCVSPGASLTEALGSPATFSATYKRKWTSGGSHS